MVAIVDEEKCTACGACESVCPVESIKVGDTAKIDDETCIDCGSCVDECPAEAISL